jgi:MFS family permease
MCNLGWTLLTDVAPKELMGLSAGVFNLCANLAGIVTPLVVGFIVGANGSFVWALGVHRNRRVARRVFPMCSWSAMFDGSNSMHADPEQSISSGPRGRGDSALLQSLDARG